MKKSLPKLPRATGSDPGPLKPATWNALCDLVESLQKQLTELRPQSSASVKFRTGKNGFTAWVPSRKKSSRPERDALQPYIRKIGADWKIFVTPGFFGSLVPSHAGGLLTDLPAPAATLTEATSLWLVVEWEPASEEDDGVHWIMPGGNLIAADFEISTSPPSETAAEVTEAGVVTNGVYAILWGEILEDDGRYALATYRSKNRAPGFCPPDNLEYPIG
jgi:hypothetical protein